VAEVVEHGLVEPKMWGQTVEAALQLFRRGQQVAAEAGLILADTKYEFGIDDSSRYWVADSYQARLAAGEEPESLDKEVVRRALLDAGYTGDGEPPSLPAEVWEAASLRYINAYERLTGIGFVPGAYPVPHRIVEALRHVL